ncbi:hypothetical protein [Roseibium sp. SCP14]
MQVKILHSRISASGRGDDAIHGLIAAIAAVFWISAPNYGAYKPNART